MAGGSQRPAGNPGSQDGTIPEPYGVDPSIAPGLPRPQGWRVALPDGTGAWDKTGPLDTDWTPITAAALVGVTQLIAGTNVTLSPPGGTGAVTVNATTQGDITAVNNGNGIVVATPTGPTPTVSADYGASSTDVAAATAAGNATTLARSDHTHQGVHEVTAAEPSLFVVPTAANRTIESRAGRLVQAQGLITETIVNRIGIAGNVMIDGTVYYMGVYLFAGETITTAHIIVNVAATTMSIGKIGLYAADGTFLRATANQTTAWETTGLKSHAFSSPYPVTVSGLYYLAIIAKAAVLPQVVASSNSAGVVLIICGTPIGAGAIPWGSQTGQADLPSPGVIAAGTAPVIRWIGVS